MSLAQVEFVMNRVNRAELSPADQKLLAEVQTQTTDLDRVFAGKNDVAGPNRVRIAIPVRA